MILAVEKGHLENVKLLLKDGRAAIDHQNNYGYTTLIEAVALRDGSEIYKQIVKVLLEGEADKTLKNNTERSVCIDYTSSIVYTYTSFILIVTKQQWLNPLLFFYFLVPVSIPFYRPS